MFLEESAKLEHKIYKETWLSSKYFQADLILNHIVAAIFAAMQSLLYRSL